MLVDNSNICFFIKNTDNFLKKLNDNHIEIDIVEINKLDIRIFIYNPDNNTSVSKFFDEKSKVISYYLLLI